MKSTASHLVLSLMLATGVVASGAMLAPPAAIAAGQTVSKRVGEPLQAALNHMKNKQNKEALAKAEEANAISGKTPYETFMVNQILGSLYAATGQYTKAAGALEAVVASGQLPPAEAVERLKQISSIYYQGKDYGKAIEFANRYNKESGRVDPEMMVLIGQSYYIQKNYKQAAETMRGAVRTAEASKRNPDKVWLELLMSAEYELGNNDGVQQVMEKLITLYPDPKYWRDFVAMNERALKGKSTKTELDLYRIKQASGILTTAPEYTTFAEVALQEGMPGEAKAVLEKGNAAGVLGQPAQKEREGRLMAMAVKQADADFKSLAQGEAEARKQPSGDALVKYGEAYWGYGQFDKSIELIQAGIAKGVTNADEAKLRLGIAYISAGRRAEALEAFKTISAGSPQGQIANLWKIHSSRKA